MIYVDTVVPADVRSDLAFGGLNAEAAAEAKHVLVCVGDGHKAGHDGI